MRNLILLIISSCAFSLCTHASWAANIPCLSPEILKIEKNVTFGFHLGYVYTNFLGDEAKELVLVNARDKEFVLEIYTSTEAVKSCKPEISVSLSNEVDPWTNDPWFREYGFRVGLNDSNNITLEEFWYGGARGFEHSNGKHTFKIKNIDTLELIGYDFTSIGRQHPSYAGSWNYLTGRYRIDCAPGVLQSRNGWKGQYWGKFESEPILLKDGELFDPSVMARTEKISATEKAQKNNFYQKCSDGNY